MISTTQKPLINSILSNLSTRPSLSKIKQSHARIILSGHANNTHLMGQFLALLAVFPSTIPLDYSLSIHQTLKTPSIFSTNNIIRCLAKSNSPNKAITVYSSIWESGLRPNKHSFTFLLQACAKAVGFYEGVQVYAHVVKLGFAGDVFVRNGLVSFYFACCEVGLAREVFEELPGCRDVVSWNAMVAGLMRCGLVKDAEEVFEEMPVRDVVSWSGMVTGYVQNGMLEEGLGCFRRMREFGVMPNEAVLVMSLSASAQLGLLGNGRMVHSVIEEVSFPLTVSIGTGLVDMYAKCGCIDQARILFDRMSYRDIWSWNVMICGLASHGLAKEAVELFEVFIVEGFQPGTVTFIGVLNACSRAGLVSEGRHYFKLMTETYSIKPEMEHYGCMVDLLARSGHVYEAREMVERMPIPPDPVLWATLLVACKIHGLAELGEQIGNELIESDPKHDGHYVQLSTIYAKARKWEDVVRVRRLMANRSTNKVAGWSLIEAQGKVHRFVAGDREHEWSSQIYKMLEEIGHRLAEAGYTPNTSSVLHDVGEEEKENSIKEHSERLAIAFGILVTRPGDAIRIVKNLRVCEDCHEVSKMISKVFEREIIVRDGSRFHHFKEGKCSCLDYW